MNIDDVFSSRYEVLDGFYSQDDDSHIAIHSVADDIELMVGHYDIFAMKMYKGYATYIIVDGNNKYAYIGNPAPASKVYDLYIMSGELMPRDIANRLFIHLESDETTVISAKRHTT